MCYCVGHGPIRSYFVMLRLCTISTECHVLFSNVGIVDCGVQSHHHNRVSHLSIEPRPKVKMDYNTSIRNIVLMVDHIRLPWLFGVILFSICEHILHGYNCVTVGAQKYCLTFAEHSAHFDGWSFVIPHVEFVQSFLHIHQLSSLFFVSIGAQYFHPIIAVHVTDLVGHYHFVKIPR